MKKLIIPYIALCFSLAGCEVKPAEIAYGVDMCDFCRMTIVDRQHAAELVTTKGKSYKYDAIECMMHALKEWDKPNVSYYLVADFNTPGRLMEAQHAQFLISESIPSPMGANLSAFANMDELHKTVNDHNGVIKNWDQLSGHFKLD